MRMIIISYREGKAMAFLPEKPVNRALHTMWITWGKRISYFSRRSSPMFTTFPAPIVINKSPGRQ